MFGRTQMEFRSCSGHVSNHQEWGQNPTGSLCICGISFGWILLCFYLHVLFKGALSIGKGQIYLVLYEYYVGSYQANIS